MAKKEDKKHAPSMKSHSAESHLKPEKKSGEQQSVMAHLMNLMLGTIALSYVVLNMIASQMVNPLYGRFVAEEVDAQVAFYKIARNLPEFQAVYGANAATIQSLEAEINKDDVTRLDTIRKLETLLDQNPNSRDLLYVIATLYQQAGDELNAGQYREKALQIDPSLE
jgi:tetratricopeptide (TPR) repeat protein